MTQDVECRVARSRGSWWAHKISRLDLAEDIAQEIHIALFKRARREWRGVGSYEARCRVLADAAACNMIRGWKRQKRGFLMAWRPLLPSDRIGYQNHDRLLVEQLLATMPLDRNQKYAVHRYQRDTR